MKKEIKTEQYFHVIIEREGHYFHKTFLVDAPLEVRISKEQALALATGKNDKVFFNTETSERIK